MSDFSNWLFDLFKALLQALWDFFTDLLIAVVDLILTALLALISALPLPAFMQAGGLQSLFAAIPSDIWFFVSHFRLGECLAMFGAAVGFRLARKAVTLFQW